MGWMIAHLGPPVNYSEVSAGLNIYHFHFLLCKCQWKFFNNIWLQTWIDLLAPWKKTLNIKAANPWWPRVTWAAPYYPCFLCCREAKVKRPLKLMRRMAARTWLVLENHPAAPKLGTCGLETSWCIYGCDVLSIYSIVRTQLHRWINK